MATKKKETTEENVSAETEAAVTETTTEKSYTYSTLKKDCRKLFGVPTIAFVAATSDLDQSNKYTISELDTIIKAWCKKEVK